MGLKFLDLFAGIGGFHMGLESQGHECVGYVEWDKFARQSYQSIYETDNLYTEKDIRNVKAEDLAKLNADIWCFGFPCTDISLAGKQEGLKNGKRSGLFFTVTELIRQLKQEVKPRYLLIENVKNLLSINDGWDFLALQIELDEIGYDTEWNVFNSADFVPQNRERVYIVGHLRGASTRELFFERGENEPTSSPTRKISKLGNVNPSGNGINGEVISSEGLAKTVTTNKGEGQKIAIHRAVDGRKHFGYGSRDVYYTDGASPTLNTMSGGGREPKILIENSSKIIDDMYSNRKVRVYDEISPTLRSERSGLKVYPCLTPDRIHKRQNGRRFKNNGEPAFTLNTQDRHGVMIKNATKKGYLLAKPGDAIDLAYPESKTRRGRVQFKRTNTLTTSDNLGTVTNDLRIRKLTPMECWRLQGFSDKAFLSAKFGSQEIAEYILENNLNHYEVEFPQVVSNSQLYKQAGNAVTQNIPAFIGEKMNISKIYW